MTFPNPFLNGGGASSELPFGTPTDGQLLIGSTADATFKKSTLTQGAGIAITNGDGAITIAATGGGFAWQEVTGTTQNMQVDTGYIANNASLVTLTLPVNAAIGSTISILGKGAGLWLVAQNNSQIINVGNTPTTTGTGGSIAATNRYDCVVLTCVEANNVWNAYGIQGNLTVT
jgi:hypothetical protein